MKLVYYCGATLLLLLGLAQLKPLYLTLTGMLSATGEFSTSYLLGKLVGHLCVIGLVLVFAKKLYRAGKQC